MNLLKISLIISVTGIFFLLLLSILIQPKQINNEKELKLNDYISVKGKIISIRNYDDFNVIKLDNNITLTCEKCKLKQNQTIIAEGKVEEYEKQLQINAEKIQEMKK